MPSLRDVEDKLNRENHLIAERIKKMNELKQKGINPYPYKFDKKDSPEKLHEKFNSLNAEEHSNYTAKTAGRIIALRRMGKITFLHIFDETGKIQCYFKEDDLKEKYDLLKLFDVGDYIGVEGKIFKTKTGEVTVNVSEFIMLSKSLRPLPEKFHGLQDIELKYRQRYLDLIMNENSRKNFIIRTKIIDAIREFYRSRGFIEVETPTLQPIYGGAAAKPFTSFHNELKMKLYLRISLELYLKRLICGGFDKVFEIGKVFRNESIDINHNPEFTLLESYEAYSDYNDIMEFVEDLYNYVAVKVLGTTLINYQGNEIDLKKPWKRMSMYDALKEYAEIDVEKLSDDDIRDLLNENKIEFDDEMSRGLLIAELFKIVEPKLIQPIFIMDHPRETTPLCKDHREKPGLIERFEPYINGWEVGNAYSELNDPVKQRYLLEEQAEQLKEGFEEANPMDEDFCKAVEQGLPPMGGLGIGIDRMIMLFTNSTSIRDVIFFPTMKLEE